MPEHTKRRIDIAPSSTAHDSRVRALTDLESIGALTFVSCERGRYHNTPSAREAVYVVRVGDPDNEADSETVELLGSQVEAWADGFHTAWREVMRRLEVTAQARQATG